ncbi:TPA: transporter [Salmonella enterica subsp. enterica]
MKRFIFLPLMTYFLLMNAMAANGENNPSNLLGAPVNTAISGGSVLPEGKLLTALNSSFRDKDHQIEGHGSPDVYSQIWLLKIRYGLTDRLELSTVGSYINNKRDNLSPEHIEGMGDQSVGVNYALMSQRIGDPFWVTVGGALLLPTGQDGDNHLPGNSAWGGRVTLTLTKLFTPNIKGDMGFVYQGPFERGNQDVKRGNEFQWNTQVRYMFSDLPLDLGLESAYSNNASGTKKLSNGSVINNHSGTTEWVVGPSFNIAVDSLKLWFGAGAFFPVKQEAKSPTKMEDVRWEFKIGKTW